MRRTKNQGGLTLVELIVAFSIMLLLTTMSVPLARAKVRRERERELRAALVDLRKAIDKYNDYATAGLIPPGKIDGDKYPESLQQLVEGVKLNGQVDKKIRFLRRIPLDPFTKSADTGGGAQQSDNTH